VTVDLVERLSTHELTLLEDKAILLTQLEEVRGGNLEEVYEGALAYLNIAIDNVRLARLALAPEDE